MQESYQAHVAERQSKAEAALEKSGFDAMVLHAGSPFRYFGDDQDAPFRSNPHFAHWVPMEGPYHLLFVQRGEKPRLFRIAPEDYWYEQLSLGDPFWASSFDIQQVGSEEEAWKALPKAKGLAYIGDAAERAVAHGIKQKATNHEELTARLDWDRSYKSAYEIQTLEEACKLAGKGHIAARDAFAQGSSELEIHHAYVEAIAGLDAELPYSSIVALDDRGATLHYETKRPPSAMREGRVLLIDVGAKVRGYGSDITRTWTRGACDPLFVELSEKMDAMQRRLCDMVRPGYEYTDFHHQAHIEIAGILYEIGVLNMAGEEAVNEKLTAPFFPHGLGHFLGIQTHDVSGHQAAPEGGVNRPPKNYPYLRTTRTMEVDQVFTVEPGVYFIPMLLRPHRTGESSRHFDWDRIDRLTPLGGVRVEDNVVVTSVGHRSLTRPYI